MLGDDGDVTGSMTSVTTGRPVSRRLRQRPFQAAEALEAVGRGARLEGAAAQQLRRPPF